VSRRTWRRHRDRRPRRGRARAHDDPRHGDPSRIGEREQKPARIPLRQFGEPQDVAETVAFLAGSAADFINGVSLPLDGGLLVVP
jgi:NAD(P)-dependent dehydrogenase (short-subunit alcohol dehydrogenase family)